LAFEFVSVILKYPIDQQNINPDNEDINTTEAIFPNIKKAFLKES
jgi:hypothetical protein